MYQKYYRAYVPEVKLYDFAFEQFYVNGKRATWARTPNKDWYFVDGYKEYPYVSGLRSANYATQKIQLKQEDIQLMYVSVFITNGILHKSRFLMPVWIQDTFIYKGKE